MVVFSKFKLEVVCGLVHGATTAWCDALLSFLDHPFTAAGLALGSAAASCDNRGLSAIRAQDIIRL